MAEQNRIRSEKVKKVRFDQFVGIKESTLRDPDFYSIHGHGD